MGPLSVTRHAGQNLVRGFCPDERLGTFVVHVQVFADSRLQFFHTPKLSTIRTKLLKIGAQMRVTVRKAWVSMASSYPWQGLYRQVWATLRC